MKKVLSLFFVFVMIFALGSFAASAAEVKYDAYADFSESKNPNGVWTYASPDGTALTEFEFGGWRIDTGAGNWGGVGINKDDNHPTIHNFIELNTAKSDAGTIGKLIFTAPEDGDYKINKFTLRVMAGSFDQQPKDFRIDVNGTNKFATAAAALDFDEDTNVGVSEISVTLKKGDKVAFYATSKDDGHISAYINPSITKLEASSNGSSDTTTTTTNNSTNVPTGSTSYVVYALFATLFALFIAVVTRKAKSN